MKKVASRRLSATDAFFVAYQAGSGILMTLGGEVTLRGKISRWQIEQMREDLLAHWPFLGQRIRRGLSGIRRDGPPDRQGMLQFVPNREALPQWRNQPIDPFREPSLQMLWIEDPSNKGHVLALKAHHNLCDGESLLAIATHAVKYLAGLCRVETRDAEAGVRQAIPQSSAAKILTPWQMIRQGHLPGLLRHTRELANEAAAGRSACLAMRQCRPADTAGVVRVIKRAALSSVRFGKSGRSIPLLWRAVAAWAKGIYRWNMVRGQGSNALISLEIPVRLRGHVPVANSIGNYISPLTVFGEADQAVEPLAREYRRQFFQQIRRRLHMAMPFLSAPGKYLPWPIFRRVAITPTATGFASSHFTWLKQNNGFADIVASVSDGDLALTDFHLYTPVCLHMGAALMVIEEPQSLTFFITYRINAVTATEAEQLADLLLAELAVADLPEVLS